MLLKGFVVSAVGIMPYFGGGLTEKRWAFNRIEETVLPKVGIMTNREKWNFLILVQPIFSRAEKRIVILGRIFVFGKNMLL